jgi:hypothetical protein
MALNAAPVYVNAQELVREGVFIAANLALNSAPIPSSSSKQTPEETDQ